MIRAAKGISTIEPKPALDRNTQERLAGLKAAIDKTVGSVFYGKLLNMSRSASIRGAYGHGGRGESIFMGQLHQILAERAGQARSYSLNESIYRRLEAAAIRQTKDPLP